MSDCNIDFKCRMHAEDTEQTFLKRDNAVGVTNNKSVGCDHDHLNGRK